MKNRLLAILLALLPLVTWGQGTIDPEPYVVLTDSNTMVTFYFDASFANYYPTSTAYWFENCSALTSISGIENLKTDNVTNMEVMLEDCSGLTSLDVSGFNTAIVTDMGGMFLITKTKKE